MELLEGIKTRRSYRGFKPTPIPEEIMKQILEAAGNSPSYQNTQPWEVAVVSGKKRDELSKIVHELAKAKTPQNSDLVHPKSWPSEHEARAREHGARRLRAMGVEREDEEARETLRLMNYEFYGAPCVILLFMDRTLGHWSVYDMGLFSQTLQLAAHSFGLGTCIQASVPGYPDEIRKFLGIPESRQLVIAISIGYPDMEAKLNTYRSIKMKLEEFVRWYS
jgi:nitroreductase